jgi:hypothetical protein
MAIKYWEFEDAPLKEKLKNPNVRELAKIYFDNETRAYRFSKSLLEVKKKGTLRLKNCNTTLPLATWKRYSKPFKNIATYIKTWVELNNNEDAEVLFANAKVEKQQKRGGRPSSAGTAEMAQEIKKDAEEGTVQNKEEKSA